MAGNSSNMPQDNCAVKTHGESIGYIIFLSCVFILTLVGNSFVCLTIILCRQLRRHITNYFIFFLAISDVAVGIFVLPFRLFMYSHNGYFCAGKGLCMMYLILDTTSGVASVTNLLIIALDRGFMIKAPYRYPVLMNRERAIFISICVWVYAHAWSWLSVFSWEDNFNLSVKIVGQRCVNMNVTFATTFLTLVYFVPLTIMGIVYSAILRTARRQVREIKELQVSLRFKENKKRARERKATKTLAIIYGAFVICWLPNCILNIASYRCPECFKSLREKNKTLFMIILITFVEVLPPLNSTMNPFIYAIFNRQFRAAFKEFLLRRKATILLDSENGMSRIHMTKRGRSKSPNNSLTRHDEQYEQNQNGIHRLTANGNDETSSRILTQETVF